MVGGNQPQPAITHPGDHMQSISQYQSAGIGIIIGVILYDLIMSMPFLQVAGVFSELELSMIRARARSGMAKARAKGKQIGRKPVTKADLPATFIKHYPAHASGSMNLSELTRICGLSRPTVHKYLKIIMLIHVKQFL